jgi:phenylacetic acid degradation operon negative regulatory protein
MAFDVINSNNVLNPRRVVLKLLLAAEPGAALSTREAIQAGACLGLSENSLRVAIARLRRTGLLQAESRGRYALGPAALGLAAEVRRWRAGEGRVRGWSGAWIGVQSAGLGRSDRRLVRARERALGLLGLRPLLPALAIRPDNLEGGVEGVRTRLATLMEAPWPTVFVISSLDAATESRARGLWPAAALARRYRQQAEKLQHWLHRADRLPLARAAREAFLIGDEAIRDLVFDPLLPAPLVDVAARAHYTEQLRQFDARGQALWRQAAPQLLGTST